MIPDQRTKLEAFSKFAWRQMREHADPNLRSRYQILHANASLILDGDERPEMMAGFAANLADLELYKSGFYDERKP